MYFSYSPLKYYKNRQKREVIAIIDFSPLWQTMEEKGITQYRLLKSGIDNKTLDTLKKNNNITDRKSVV